MFRKVQIFALALLLALFSNIEISYSQVTTSTLSGNIVDEEGNNLIGATVKAIHEPSGTVYGARSLSNGTYRISNMRVGGPYSISVKYVGLTEQKVENMNLRLGQTEILNFVMSASSVQKEAITVTAKSGSVGQNSGMATQITTSDIENLPTISRSINDFVRLTPQANAYGGGVSLGGTNNRYNAIFVDGAINNDVFGLASSGTNGGQTGISPFSLDILDQVQVVLSPYDVTLSGFAGGGINAVTRSGTNEFKATAYTFMKNESLTGMDNGVLAGRLNRDRESVPDFMERQYGFSASGPIIEDKLFFFTNVEIQADETPVPFDFNEYTSVEGRASAQQLESLRQHLITNYGYDPGTFGNTAKNLDGMKFFGKINYNFDENHNLLLRHQYTKGEQSNRFAGNRNRINFSNNGIFFPTTTNSSALEINSNFGNDYNNKFILGYTRVRDNRTTLGQRFPYVSIDDASSGSIQFGSEQFSTANVLNQDVISLTNNFQIFSGDHTITLGTHNEYYQIYNLFLRQNFGFYRFSSIDDFVNGELPIQYQRTYALPGAGDGAADFSAMQFGVYGQDEWRVNDNLNLTFGLRFDLPMILDNPRIDDYFNNTALPKIQELYDEAKNTTAGSAPDPQLMISPRVGFAYRFDNEEYKPVVRGGVGVFTSRIPFVWPGAMFTNNGLTAGGVDLRTGRDEMINFNPNPNTQIDNPDFKLPSGQMDLFTADFKYPQVLRTSLAFDVELPFGIESTLEGFYTKTLNNILYTNVNSDPTVAFQLTGSPDNRNVYGNKSIDPTYTAVYLASNTSEGYTYNVTYSLAKAFDFGLRANLAYSWSDAQALTEGTSSQNSSQWRGQVNINGRNNPELGRSDFAAGHRIVGAFSFTHQWTDDNLFGTTVSLFINAQSGIPYSYVIGGPFAAQNLNRETGSVNQNVGLVYIPNNQSEINLVDYTASGNTVTAAEQWTKLNAFIEDSPYLSKNRGSYAEKNASFAPFVSTFDISLRQDLGIAIGGTTHRFQLSADIFNFGNMINDEWGTVYTPRGSGNNYFLYTFEGYEDNGTTPKFTFRDSDTGLDKYNIDPLLSRWRAQIGIRYLFN